MADSSKKSGGSRKIGRNRAKCQSYQMRGTRERNKRVKMEARERRLARQRAKRERDARFAAYWGHDR